MNIAGMLMGGGGGLANVMGGNALAGNPQAGSGPQSQWGFDSFMKAFSEMGQAGGGAAGGQKKKLPDALGLLMSLLGAAAASGGGNINPGFPEVGVSVPSVGGKSVSVSSGGGAGIPMQFGGGGGGGGGFAMPQASAPPPSGAGGSVGAGSSPAAGGAGASGVLDQAIRLLSAMSAGASSAMPTQTAATRSVSGGGVPAGFPNNVNGRYTTGPFAGKEVVVPPDLARQIAMLQMGLLDPSTPSDTGFSFLPGRPVGQIWGIPGRDFTWPADTPWQQGRSFPVPAAELAREADLEAQMGMFDGGWRPVF